MWWTFTSLRRRTDNMIYFFFLTSFVKLERYAIDGWSSADLHEARRAKGQGEHNKEASWHVFRRAQPHFELFSLIKKLHFFSGFLFCVRFKCYFSFFYLVKDTTCKDYERLLKSIISSFPHPSLKLFSLEITHPYKNNNWLKQSQISSSVYRGATKVFTWAFYFYDGSLVAAPLLRWFDSLPLLT